MMNYVYERDYAVLTPAESAGGRDAAAHADRAPTCDWLACTDKICVPEKGRVALDVPVGGMAAPDRALRRWRRALPRPLSARRTFQSTGDRSAGSPSRCPASVEVGEPYVFPID